MAVYFLMVPVKEGGDFGVNVRHNKAQDAQMHPIIVVISYTHLRVHSTRKQIHDQLQVTLRLHEAAHVCQGGV
jgi:hypothetical protein